MGYFKKGEKKVIPDEEIISNEEILGELWRIFSLY